MKRLVTWIALAAMLALAVWNADRLVALRERKPAAPTQPPPADPVRRARLVFAGDLMQHLPQVAAARQGDGTFDYASSFRHVAPIFRQADLAVLNLETTLCSAPPYTGYPMFRSPAALADALARMGIDAAMLANNHICDGGRRGLRSTLALLDSAGVRHTGAFADSAHLRRDHPLRLEAGGLRFALLNYTYGTNGLPTPPGTVVNRIDTLRIARDLQAIGRDSTDAVIVFLHWGEEYARSPGAQQRRLAAFCHRRGADVVIGSHPHVVQPLEAHRDAQGAVRAVTVYSLGNLVSNQRRRYCDGGLIVTLDVERSAREAPLRIDPYYTPVWVHGPDYRIVPAAVGDTMAMSGAARALYTRFMEDTRLLLGGDTTWRER